MCLCVHLSLLRAEEGDVFLCTSWWIRRAIGFLSILLFFNRARCEKKAAASLLREVVRAALLSHELIFCELHRAPPFLLLLSAALQFN